MTIFIEVQSSCVTKSRILREPVDWNDEKVTLLQQLWSRGWSALQIAYEIPGTTRSGILGKLKRLRDKGNPVRARAKNPKPVQQRRHRVNPHKTIVLKAPIVVPIVEFSDNDIALEQRKQLIELTNETCRFPCGDVGTPEFFFCGALEADCSGGKPYCRLHTARAIGRAMNADERRELRAKLGPTTNFGQR